MSGDRFAMLRQRDDRAFDGREGRDWRDGCRDRSKRSGSGATATNIVVRAGRDEPNGVGAGVVDLDGDEVLLRAVQLNAGGGDRGEGPGRHHGWRIDKTYRLNLKRVRSGLCLPGQRGAVGHRLDVVLPRQILQPLGPDIVNENILRLAYIGVDYALYQGFRHIARADKTNCVHNSSLL